MRTTAMIAGVAFCFVAGCSPGAGDRATASADATGAPGSATAGIADVAATSAMPEGGQPLVVCEREPTSAEVFAALVSVNYHAPDAGPDGMERLPVQDVDDALRVLWCDKSFGADARRSYAVERLGKESPIFQGLDLDLEGGKTSPACCAKLNDCKLAKADPSFMEGAVWFDLDVPGAYRELAEKLDPQSWSEMKGSWFRRTERQMVKECSADKPDDVDVPAKDLGNDWCDVIYERFEYLPDSSVGLSFENSLFFRTELDPVDPKDPSRTLRTYRVDYGVCPEGSHSARFRGGETVSDALLRDSGCSSATDFDSTDDGGGERSYVSGVKRLQFDTRLCADGICNTDDARFVDAILRALVVATRISLCDRKGVQPAACTWPVTCDTEDGIDSGIYDCGFSEDEDFHCPD